MFGRSKRCGSTPLHTCAHGAHPPAPAPCARYASVQRGDTLHVCQDQLDGDYVLHSKICMVQEPTGASGVCAAQHPQAALPHPSRVVLYSPHTQQGTKHIRGVVLYSPRPHAAPPHASRGFALYRSHKQGCPQPLRGLLICIPTPHKQLPTPPPASVLGCCQDRVCLSPWLLQGPSCASVLGCCKS
jgi:hypothetical protein